MACCFNTLLFCLKYIVGMKTQWIAVTSYWCKKKTHEKTIWLCGVDENVQVRFGIIIIYIYYVYMTCVGVLLQKISKHRRIGSPLNGWTVMLECYWNRSWSDGMSCWCCTSWVLENGGACHGHFGWESGIRSHWGICQCQLAGPIYIARAVGVKKRTKVGQGVGVGEDLLQSSSWLV